MKFLVTLTWRDTATAASARTDAVTSPNPTASMNWLIGAPSCSVADGRAPNGDERHEAFIPPRALSGSAAGSAPGGRSSCHQRL